MTRLIVRNAACRPRTVWDEMEDTLNRIVRGGPVHASDSPAPWTPAVDLRETEDAYHIDVDLPGVKKDALDITVQDGLVTVKGERKRAEDARAETYRRTERRHGPFERTFRLPQGVDPDQVAARFEDGVLTVTAPKPAEVKPRQVQVTAA